MQLIDTCIKNGGDHFLAEIASKEFVDELAGIIKSPVSQIRLVSDLFVIHELECQLTTSCKVLK
jgi:hypothetical protein